MNSSAFQWLRTLLISFFLTAFCLNSFLSSATQISYSDHCNSIVPESTLNKFEPALSSFPRLHTGHYTGGDEILSQNAYSLTFCTPNVYKTEKDGVFGIEGTLLLRSRNTYSYDGGVTYLQVARSYDPGAISHEPGVHRRRSLVRFRLHGFWSESSGNLCMVGTEDELPNLAAVLKLSNLKNSSDVTTLVSGRLECMSSANDLNYFEPISILIPPRMSYEYSLASKDLSNEFSGGNDTVKCLPLSSLPRTSFCSVVLGGNEFNLNYVGYYHPFDPIRTLVAEGYWDDKMNKLFIVACRFLNSAESSANAYIGDCTTRLSLSFPSIWSIRQSRNIVGEIWSKKAVNDSGYFEKIHFQNSENSFRTVSGLKYEYSEINRARELCWPKWKPQKSNGKKYPSEHSYDMQFNIRVHRPSANRSRGYATPLSVGDQFYPRYLYSKTPLRSSTSRPKVQESFNRNSQVNISYKIGIRLLPGATFGGQVYSLDISRSSYEGVEISAEGIYDSKTGQLCMVGCRSIVSNNLSSTSDSMDCEILLNFQFPPSNPKENEGHIKGSIKSMRAESDPLYFEPMEVYSVSYSALAVKKSISKIDWAITVALISNTLACIFVGLQLLHVKKHPEVLPSISLVMLLLLTLGHMIPLMLNFEALFLKNLDRPRVLLSRGGWLEVNEVLVRIITMVAFLLEFRLLQLSWSAKLADGQDQPGLWLAEKRSLFVSFSLYAPGAIIFYLFNWREHNHYLGLLSSPQRFYPQPQRWEGLKLYAGFVLDGFLLPQILFNIFRNSKDNALASSFYIGVTSLRLLPHAYHALHTNADYFSDACNIIVSVGGMMFAAVIFLQQLFGGCCNDRKKFIDGQAYEKVSIVSET
ncbi:hypothetical protein WN944_001592 [Citrus x changshan-huyou]|uniref:RING-type E3 ubiquitin transferase n=1 Tax=Citrus x changshan-huyou TaxID=2935761 RepID=A0AAP0MGP4_9ROSI